VNYSDFWCKSRKISVSRGVERCRVECFKRSEARVSEVWRGGGEMGGVGKSENTHLVSFFKKGEF
jgi:hypothetical protein